jgi:hypothetical protein
MFKKAIATFIYLSLSASVFANRYYDSDDFNDYGSDGGFGFGWMLVIIVVLYLLSKDD